MSRGGGARWLAGGLALLLLYGCGPVPESGEIHRQAGLGNSPPSDELRPDADFADDGGDIGVVVRAVQIPIPAPFDGRLVERFVGLGEEVAAGARLGRFDTDAVRRRLDGAIARVRRAEASRDAARLEVERIRAPSERPRGQPESLSTGQWSEVDAAIAVGVAEIKAAEAHLEHAVAVEAEARAQLSLAMLRSPVAGVISGVHGLPGVRYARGWTVFTVGSGEWRVRFATDSGTASYLDPGDAVAVRAGPGGAPKPGIVLSVPPGPDARSMLTHVEAALCDDGALPAGTAVRVALVPDGVAGNDRYTECRVSQGALLGGGAPAPTAPSRGE